MDFCLIPLSKACSFDVPAKNLYRRIYIHCLWSLSGMLSVRPGTGRYWAIASELANDGTMRQTTARHDGQRHTQPLPKSIEKQAMRQAMARLDERWQDLTGNAMARRHAHLASLEHHCIVCIIIIISTPTPHQLSKCSGRLRGWGSKLSGLATLDMWTK